MGRPRQRQRFITSVGIGSLEAHGLQDVGADASVSGHLRRAQGRHPVALGRHLKSSVATGPTRYPSQLGGDGEQSASDVGGTCGTGQDVGDQPELGIDDRDDVATPQAVLHAPQRGKPLLEARDKAVADPPTTQGGGESGRLDGDPVLRQRRRCGGAEGEKAAPV